MGALYGFLTGAAVGTGVTLLCTIAWRGGSSGLPLGDAVTPGGASVASLDKQVRTLRMQRDIAEEKLAARDADLARLAKELDLTRATAPVAAEAAPPAPTAPAGPPETGVPGAPDERAEARRAWREFRNKLGETAAPLRRADAPAADRVAALSALLAGLADPDPRRAEAVADTLASVGDHMTPAELTQVEEAFRAAPTGAAIRPALAAALARGLAQQPRLGEFLASLPPVDEPDIREAVLRRLDRDPSAAYRSWTLKLCVGEQNPAVLDELWDEDRVVATLTRDTAAPYREAVEPRLAGDAITDATLRGRGYLAVALCGMYDADGTAAALGRLVAGEKHPKVKALGEALRDAVRGGEANLASLVKLWDDRRRDLRE